MAVMERLALIIDADGKGAVRELDKVGRAADRELGRAESKSEKWGKTFTSVGTKMVATSAVVGAALWNAAQSASDLNEAVSQTEQIFGTAAPKVQEFAESAVSIGQSERAALEAANTFGLFFEKANLGSDAAADMSIQMAELASDMASFKNTTPEEAVQALGAALRGESEPIRNYGVLLDEATLKQRALDMGLIDSTSGTLPPAIRMQAAYAEVLEQTSTIQGDFVRTADGAANAQRIAAAEFENAKASIGEGFLPIMQGVVGTLGDVASGFKGVNDATGGAVGNMLALSTVVAGVGGAVAVAAGQTIQLVTALKKAGESSKYIAMMNAALGPLAVSLAGVTALWVAMKYHANDAKEAATGVGIGIEESILNADPDKLRRQIGVINEEIGSVQEKLSGSSEWAFWDTDYRQDLNALGTELEKQGSFALKLNRQMVDLSSATGNSEANILDWLQTQAEAGIVYEDSAGALEAYRRAVEAAGAEVDSATSAELELAEQYADSREQLDKLIDSVDEYFSTLDGSLDTQVNWEAAVDNLRGAIEENGTAWDYMNERLDIGTEAGRNNLAAMRESRDAAVDFGQAVLEQGGTLDEATAATMAHVDQLRQQLLAAGYSESAVESLIAQLGLTPEQVTTAFQQPGMDAAMTNAAQYEARLRTLQQIGTITTNLITQAQGTALGGFLFGGGRASGGPVQAGTSYLVGERGPELVTMGAGGTVHNAAETERMMGGGTQVIQLVVDGKTLAEVVAPELAKDRRAHTGSRRVG